jgi:AcrR family transcriptional regulator
VDAAGQTDGTFAELLDRLVGAYLGYLKEHPQLAAVLLRAMLEGDPKDTGLLINEIVPLLTRVEELLAKKGKGVIAPDFPVRAAILQIATAALIQCSAGQIRAMVWGASDQTMELARALFLGSPKPQDEDVCQAPNMAPHCSERPTKGTNDGIQQNRRQ